MPAPFVNPLTGGNSFVYTLPSTDGTSGNPFVVGEAGIPVSLSIQTVTLSAQNTEGSVVITGEIAGLWFVERSRSKQIRWALATGKVANSVDPYIVLPSGVSQYFPERWMLPTGITLYFATSATVPATIEILIAKKA